MTSLPGSYLARTKALGCIIEKADSVLTMITRSKWRKHLVTVCKRFSQATLFSNYPSLGKTKQHTEKNIRADSAPSCKDVSVGVLQSFSEFALVKLTAEFGWLSRNSLQAVNLV